MITTLRGYVAHNDLWPWPISSRSFGLDWEDRVRSVASTVLDGFFLYFAQIITIIRGCVVCYVFSESENLNFWQIFEIFRPWPWKKIYSSQWILSIFSTNDHYHERVCHAQWPLTLTYIFKVIRPWLWKSCPLSGFPRCPYFLEKSLLLMMGP